MEQVRRKERFERVVVTSFISSLLLASILLLSHDERNVAVSEPDMRAELYVP